jgi:hypothetical protein
MIEDMTLRKLSEKTQSGYLDLRRTYEELQPGNVQVRLVDGDPLDDGGDALQRRHDLPRDPCVLPHARADIDAFWRQAARGLGDRHGGVDTISPGLVGAGGDDAALTGLGADHRREPPPLRMVALLDGGVEGVEIDVHEEAGHGADEGSRVFFEQPRLDCRF